MTPRKNPPISLFMVLDQREDVLTTAITRWVDYLASYHNNAGGVTLADGHSVIKKWIDPRTSVPIRKGINIPVFVTSPRNEDVL